MERDASAPLPAYWLRTLFAGQIALTHAAAAGGAWMLILLNRDAVFTQIVFAMLVAALIGIILTINLQNDIALVYDALVRMTIGLVVPPIRMWRIDPLFPFLRQANTLSRRDVGNLRDALLAQTREAAIQGERNRLARELHDSIKQQMFSINVSAAAAEVQWDQNGAAAREALMDVRQSVREAMVELNALLQHLAPAPLEKVGLIQALREQAEALGYRTGAQVRVEVGELPDDERLPIGAQEALFRIAQEALSNVARHARAQTVTLWLYEQGDQIHLVLEDDGQGFDVQRISGGMGLSNIRSRTAALSGHTQISSAFGSGTTIHASVPLTDSILLQEEIMDKIDHTYNKIFLAGIVGGLLIIGALYIPLYVLLPGQYLRNWPQAPTVLGPVCWLIAVALMVATGYVAARWAKAGSRLQAALFGALAGGAAVLIAFVGIGAGAAGMLGTSPILAWGFRSATDHFHLMQIGMDSMLGAVIWNYRVLWGGFFAGIGLGALGGFMAEPVRVRLDSDNLLRGARLLLNLAIAGSSLVLTVHLPMLTLVEPVVHQIWEIVIEARPLMFLPETVVLWPIGSTFVTLITALGIRYAIQRADARSDDMGRLLAARTSGLILAAWSPVLIAFLIGITPGMFAVAALRPILWIGFALCAVLSLLFAVEAWHAGRRLSEVGVARSARVQIGGVVLALLLFIAFTMLFLLPGMNGWARNAGYTIYHSAWSQMDIGNTWPYVLPFVNLMETTNQFLREFAWFDQYGFLKTMLGAAGLVLVHWLLRRTAVHKTAGAHSLHWRQFTRAAAGSLLGLILIISAAGTLPGTATTTIYLVVFPSTGVEMFRDRGAVPDPYERGLQVLPLWPLSYYGEGVTEVPDPTPPGGWIEFSRQTGIPVEKLRAADGATRTLEFSVAGSYRQQYIGAVAIPVVLLILSGLVWLVVAGIDFLAWRRARELAQQLRDQDQASAAS